MRTTHASAKDCVSGSRGKLSSHIIPESYVLSRYLTSLISTINNVTLLLNEKINNIHNIKFNILTEIYNIIAILNVKKAIQNLDDIYSTCQIKH